MLVSVFKYVIGFILADINIHLIKFPFRGYTLDF